MPREAGERSVSGYYHVMLRGYERRNIFMDRSDREKFLTLLSRQTEKGTIAVIAYCLMDNHLHLLVKENENGLAKAMSSVGTAYVIYFNEKYYRSGHLFQNRYKSEAIEDEAYLFAALRYIHQNPVKAAMCEEVKVLVTSDYAMPPSIKAETQKQEKACLYLPDTTRSLKPEKA